MLQKILGDNNMQKSKVFSLKTFLILGVSFLMISALFLLSACNEEFNNSLVIKQNAPNTASSSMQYTQVEAKMGQDIYLTWTIDENAKDNASSYTLIITDNDKNNLTKDNALKSLVIYDENKKSLGTVTTQTYGQYALSAVLADNKISAGTYYAVAQFNKDGTYNVCLQLNE